MLGMHCFSDSFQNVHHPGTVAGGYATVKEEDLVQLHCRQIAPTRQAGQLFRSLLTHSVRLKCAGHHHQILRSVFHNLIPSQFSGKSANDGKAFITTGQFHQLGQPLSGIAQRVQPVQT